MITIAKSALYAGIFLVACSAPAREDAESADSPIIGAEGEDGDAADDAIVAVVSPESATWICSGAVIAPKLVVTAGHCARHAPHLRVLAGTKRQAPTASVEVLDFVAQGDVAVLRLAGEVTDRTIPWNASPRTELAANAEVRIVGYGFDIPRTAGGPKPTAGVRRSAPAAIASVNSAYVLIGPSTTSPCDGDSGSPMLMTLDGVETLVAIAHSVDGASCGQGATYERVDIHASLLQTAL